MIYIGLKDEKDLIIVAIIAAVFIATTLSFNVGSLFAGMIFAYAIAINQGSGRVYEIIKGRVSVPKSLFLGSFVVGAWYFLSQAAFSILGLPHENAFSVLASAVSVPFTISNPAIQVLVWGVFIPFAETVFFLGVALKLAQKKAESRERLNDFTTWVGILVIGALATLFHVVVRVMNDSALIVDFLFFTLSAAFVIHQRGELKGPLFAHIIINTYVMSRVVGFV